MTEPTTPPTTPPTAPPPGPAGVPGPSSVGRKLATSLLDIALILTTFGIGWLLWGSVVAADGRTPGRQLLRSRLVRTRDGRPLGWARMVLVRGLLGTLVSTLAWVLSLGVLVFLPLWDRRNQTVTDKLTSSVEVDDPPRCA